MGVTVTCDGVFPSEFHLIEDDSHSQSRPCAGLREMIGFGTHELSGLRPQFSNFLGA